MKLATARDSRLHPCHARDARATVGRHGHDVGRAAAQGGQFFGGPFVGRLAGGRIADLAVLRRSRHSFNRPERLAALCQWRCAQIRPEEPTQDRGEQQKSPRRAGSTYPSLAVHVASRDPSTSRQP